MRRYQPALLGGVFIGVLSSLPVVNIVNTCCCLWVVVGGVLTAYLQQQNRPDALDAAEAALGGLIAGLIGALISVPISALVAMSGDMQGQLQTMIDQWQMPPDVRDRLTGLMSGPRLVVLTAAITAIADRDHPRPSRRQLLDYAVIGVLLLGIGNGFVMWSERRIPSGIAALLVGTVPLWITLLDGLRPGGQRWTPRVWLGTLIGFVGAPFSQMPHRAGGE